MDERYLLWSDVQQAFEGVIYLTDSSLEGALFMVDNDGELRHPLCIKYYEYSEYIPVCRRPQMYRQTESEDPKQGSDHVPTVTVVPDDTETPGNMMELALRDLDDLLKGCRGKNQFLELRANVDRRYYQMTAASSRYFSSMLVEELERLDMDGTAVLADGKNQVQILEELHGFEQQAHEWDHRNICWNMLAETDNSWDFATSRLFIVLPSDLNSWNDSDPSTHQFRLCFLCDNNNTISYSEESPRHVHLSDHPGYSLKRPQEFIQTYGYYMLRILLMIKHGFSSAEYDIPSLDTFKILWNCNPDVSGSHLTKETLGRLVDKAVAHLQVLSLPKRKAQLALTRKESAAIKTYLDMQDGDNAQGSLHRLFAFGQRVYWRCQAHSPQNLQAQQLKELKEFVCSIGGDVDMRQAKLHVDLHSAVEAHRFRTLLQGAKHIFDISLKFCWPATQSVVQELGHGIGKTGTVALEIEGLSPDFYPGSYMQPLSHFFYSRVPSYVWLKYVTLLNYPRPQEQCIRIGSLSLRSTLTPERTGFDWIALSSDFDKVRELLSKAKEPHDCDIATKELRLVLERHGFPDATVATIYAAYWIAAFDLEQAAFVEAYSTNMSCPNAVLSSGSLRKLAVHIHDEEDELWFFDVVQSNNFLQELKLTHSEM
ncbi:hypothetical protein BG000_007265 [Podila horticola]|nr:hypothetical protein BG000_007265 [Podila horticola]